MTEETIMTNKAAAMATHNNFTPLRLILASLVMIAHFRYLTGVNRTVWPFVYADFAVDGFFIVSGYLIYASFDLRPDYFHFFLRRFVRLYPLYITVVVAQTVILLTLQPDGVTTHLHEAVSYFLLNAVFLNFLRNNIGHVMDHLADPSLNPSLWTLKVEVTFYIMAPLIWLGIRRWGIGWLLVTLVVSAIYSDTMRHFGKISLSRELPGAMQYFIIGILAYKYREFIIIRTFYAVITASICAFSLTLIVMRIPPFQNDHWRIIFPILVGPVVIVLALMIPPVRLKRDISYGIYLLHGPTIQLLVIAGLVEFSMPSLVVVVALVVTLSFIAEYVIERPLIEFGRRLSVSVAV